MRVTCLDIDHPKFDRETRSSMTSVVGGCQLCRPTVEAVKEVFGTAPERCDRAGEQAALSNERAAELVDWTPEYTQRTAAAEAQAEGPALVLK